MSYRKTRLIQERNLLLERKYILEQAPPPPPPAVAPPPVAGTPPPPPPPAPVTGTPPPPAPAGGTTPSTGTTSDQTKKFTEKDIKTATHCSKKAFKIDSAKYEKKEEKINGVDYVYYLNEKKDMILCRDKPK